MTDDETARCEWLIHHIERALEETGRSTLRLSITPVDGRVIVGALEARCSANRAGPDAGQNHRRNK